MTSTTTSNGIDRVRYAFAFRPYNLNGGAAVGLHRPGAIGRDSISYLHTPFSDLSRCHSMERHNESSIYRMLDWQKPGKSIVVCVLGVFFVFVIHFLCYCMYCLRVWLYARFCLPEPIRNGSRNGEKISCITRSLSTMEESQREQFLNPSTVIDLK
ncbi:hypothetical protein RP20_CCG017579 [Aedes albopictus]|nr:hypothetical protein RP20_CCG017579 [Aedes albopictus]